MRIDGACHCSQISFAAEIDPTRVMVCQCADCQVLSGGPYRTVVLAPIETLVLSGQPKSYIKVAENGNRRAQMFCPDFGTPLFATAPEHSNSVSIGLGCVKRRAQLTPAAQTWQRSSMSCVYELDRIPGSSEQQALLPIPQRPAL